MDSLRESYKDIGEKGKLLTVGQVIISKERTVTQAY